MDCKRIQSMIIPYIRDELNNEELELFLDHINSCKECREELEIYYIIEVGLNADKNTENLNIQKSLVEKIRESNLLLSRLKPAKILYYALNTLLFLGTVLAVLVQLRIWWQGGYF